MCDNTYGSLFHNGINIALCQSKGGTVSKLQTFHSFTINLETSIDSPRNEKVLPTHLRRLSDRFDTGVMCVLKINSLSCFLGWCHVNDVKTFNLIELTMY